MNKLCGAAVLATTLLLVAGCQTARGPGASANGTAIKIANADPTKWEGRRVPSMNATVWTCRPLACADRAVVAVQTARSPTRNPDPKALEKLAKMLPAQTKAQNVVLEIASDGNESIETLSSKVTRLRDYPAILTESKRSGRGKPTYTVTGHIFAGLVHIKLMSQSVDRVAAKRHFEDFVDVINIDDHPPAESAAAAAAQAAPAAPAAAAPAG